MRNNKLEKRVKTQQEIIETLEKKLFDTESKNQSLKQDLDRTEYILGQKTEFVQNLTATLKEKHEEYSELIKDLTVIKTSFEEKIEGINSTKSSYKKELNLILKSIGRSLK